jgi:hypothetical protein
MPRDPLPVSETRNRLPALPSNSLVASVARYEGGRMDRIWLGRRTWQEECYHHFEICGEARYAAWYYGNALSRATLGVGQAQPDGSIKPITTGKPKAVLDDLFAGYAGQSDMLAAVGVHLTIAGECYLIGREIDDPVTKQKIDYWEVVSIMEMNVTQQGGGQRWAIDYGDGRPPVELTDDDVAIRIWLFHPGRRMEADSPFRSLLPTLREIERMTMHLTAQVFSRLASNGILPFPSETTFPQPPPGPDGKARATISDLDGFMKVLADASVAAMANLDSPAARLPIFVKMPGDYIDKLKVIEFWSKLDDKAMLIRTNAIGRFYDGMDLPREIGAGMASSSGTGGGRSNGVSHWGAWQIEESTIKMHVEPKLQMFVNALTLGYLRPLTEGTEVVTFDTAELRLRPDRSDPALALYDRLLLSGTRAVQENGFKTTDMMTDEEMRKALLIKIATGSSTPQMVAAANELLGVDIPIPTDAPATNNNGAQPAPAAPDPQRPRTPQESAALLPAAEALVLRALERAGNRMRAKGVKAPGVPAFAMHTVHKANGDAAEFLADAWSTADIVFAGDSRAGRLVEAMDAYCRSLLLSQSGHDRDLLATYVEAACSP